MIRLTIPSRLECRDLAVRTVASACKLVRGGGDDFHNEVISAFSEALNNVIIHGNDHQEGDLVIEIEPASDRITIRLKDFGSAFDPASVPAPDLDSLPESGLGIFIMRSFMDDITYTGGVPNTLSMTRFSKRTKRAR